MATKKLKRSSRWGLAVILIVMLFICGFIFWKTMALEEETAALDHRYSNIQTQIEDEYRKNASINNDIRFRQTDDYIKDQARNIFGLRDPDETIFLPGAETENKEKEEQ